MMLTDQVMKLETNIDDTPGEALGFVMEELFQAGALDVFYTPIYMKKNRPAWLLTVICRPQDRQILEELIFSHTTTIGIRRSPMERTILARQGMELTTSLGKVQVKLCQTPTGMRAYPEYESIARICRERGGAYLDVYQKILKEVGDRTYGE